MKRLTFLALAAIANPAFAQAMDPSMPGMDMGDHRASTPPPVTPAPAPPSRPTPSADEPTGTDQSPGSAAPPPVAHDHPAARYFDPHAMAAAEVATMAPASGYSQIRLDLAEYQFRNGHDGYRWEGEAWMGDLNRLLLRGKGEGTTGQRMDSAELQALYSLALDPWWNLAVVVRQDIRPTPAPTPQHYRTNATIGMEGLAPYSFDVRVAAFASDRGQVSARIETSFDERLTRRLILQPRVELDLSAQDMPAQRLGDGLNSAELGLRLRYEITRQCAPYGGVSWNWAAGKTARYLRADGNSPRQRSIVIGIRSWF